MTKRIRRRQAIVAGAATLAMPAVPRAAPPGVKLGLIHPVTGPLAFSGSQYRLGGQLAIADVNAAGGIKAIGGAKLEALLGGAQLKPQRAASLVDQVSEAGAAGFTGCFSSSLGLAAAQAVSLDSAPASART